MPTTTLTQHTTHPTQHKRYQRSWQPSGDSSKADEVYLRRQKKPDEQTMKSMKTTNRFTPLENSLDERTMNWHNDALRPAHDAKEMYSHLQPTDRLSKDDKPTKRLSSNKHAIDKNSNSNTKKHTTNNQFHVLSPTLHLNEKDKMLFVPLQFNNYESQGLLDTGAVQSAVSEAELRKITSAHPEAVLDELPPPNFKVQITAT